MPARLREFSYTGRWRYFVTCPTHKRARVFDSDQLARRTITALLHGAREHEFAVIAYCFMPDHVHLLVTGDTPRAAFRPFIRVFRRRAAWHCRDIVGVRLWQRGYYERVLRAHEPNERVIAYILGNPLCAVL